jgi:diguanylate cyclase (GGDEF)-like protein
MELKLYMRMIKQGWWIILLTILIAVNTALISAYLTQPIYQANASFSVSPSATLIGSDQEVLNSLEALDKRSIIQTYAEFLNSQSIYEETVQNMGLALTELTDYTRSTVVLPDANILDLTFEGPDPQLVATLANNTGQTAINHIKDLYKVYDINPLDPAVIPTIPIKPQPLRDAGVAAVLGLVLGVALAIVNEQIRIPLESYRLKASLDPVSNVFNHRYVQHLLDDWHSHGSHEKYSLGLIRLNGLRGMVDTLPSTVVQQLLRQVTAIFKKELRGNDVIGRWDETTFVIILPKTSEEAATRTMERIRTTLQLPIELANFGETIQLEPTISVSSYHDGESAGYIIEQAEFAIEHSSIH